MRMLAMPEGVERWTLTTLRKKLIRIGAWVVSHDRYVNLQDGEHGGAAAAVRESAAPYREAKGASGNRSRLPACELKDFPFVQGSRAADGVVVAPS
jgi:hypothetical protein